jgi:hypothetical protein
MSSVPFKIIRVERHSQEELCDRLRNVNMLLEREAYPYKEVEIELRKVSFSQVVPAQRYVLGDALKRAQNLEWELAAKGVDLFALNGYVTIWTDQAGEDTPIDVLPPIIEHSVEANGESVNIINDGMHRMYVARLEWRSPEVVFIHGVPKAYPYYAYPIPEGNWNEVSILPGSSIPEDMIKKWHRIPDNKKLYRDFNSAFNNVGGPRGQG